MDKGLEELAVLLTEICIAKEEEFDASLRKEGILFSRISFAKEVRYKNMENWLKAEAGEGE